MIYVILSPISRKYFVFTSGRLNEYSHLPQVWIVPGTLSYEDFA